MNAVPRTGLYIRATGRLAYVFQACVKILTEPSIFEDSILMSDLWFIIWQE